MQTDATPEAPATAETAGKAPRRYLITVPAPARRLSPTTWATESAFIQHLRDLKRELGPSWGEMIVAMPWYDDADWAANKDAFEVVDETKENIRYVPLHRHGCSKVEFLKSLPKLLPPVYRAVAESDFVHSNFTPDLYRPIGAWISLFAVMQGKPVLAVEDMDRRRDAEMNYSTGIWSKRTYLICKYVYDPARHYLQRLYVRYVDLMLFKEMAMVEYYGRGSDHVRLFLDPNFSEEHIASDAMIEAKVKELAETARPLRLLYFGRLVPYKGVDRMLEAVATARKSGANLTFDIMGAGEQGPALKALAERLGITDVVQWLEPVPYGEGFFATLRARDVLLACPLSADTPRSAWDALAIGMPVVAFDSPFYVSLGKISHAVEVTPWPQVEPLAAKLTQLAADKQLLAPMVRSAVETARQNTGTSWLKRRVQWVEDLMQRTTSTGAAQAR